MAINKPPTPEVHYFSTAMYASCFVALVTFISMWFNVEPVGDLPWTNWLIWLACFGLVFVGRWLQVVQIKKRVEPKWNYPDVEPWSSPLRMSVEKYAGGPLLFAMWYSVSAGYTLEEGDRRLMESLELRIRMNKKYEDYLAEYCLAYPPKEPTA